MTGSGGTVGGRYALVERIGSGAMGVVWRARDELLDREVAVKQLRGPEPTPEEAGVAGARAMREARNAARLQHPNAVAVFDVVVEDDRPWLVMEHLPSRSLSALLAERGSLSPAETARIGGRVAEALAAAHAAGIVHRDVKPSNVLIGHDGTVKLTDFGISRAAGDGTLTDSGMITGTPAYLAPEVARGEQPGPASDVFSLGATLYAATEGQAPYGAGDNSFGLLYRAAAGRIEPPTRSGELTGPLSRMLATDPASRPTAAEAVRLLTGPDPGERRRRWVAPLVVALVLLLAGATAATVSLLLPGGPGRDASTEPPAEQAPQYTVDDAVALVRGHYESLPEDVDTAYDNLAVTYRQPFDAYQEFWGRYDNVVADDVEAWQDHPTSFTVRARVTFRQGPTEVTGFYQLVVQPWDGRLRIVASEQLT